MSAAPPEPEITLVAATERDMSAGGALPWAGADTLAFAPKISAKTGLRDHKVMEVRHFLPANADRSLIHTLLTALQHLVEDNHILLVLRAIRCEL